MAKQSMKVFRVIPSEGDAMQEVIAADMQISEATVTNSYVSFYGPTTKTREYQYRGPLILAMGLGYRWSVWMERELVTPQEETNAPSQA